MAEKTETTTIEVKTDVWAALDRRKGEGETFSQVVRRLINATPVGVGELQVDNPPEIEHGTVEELTEEQKTGGIEKNCAHYDVIDGEDCPNELQYRQQWRYADSEDSEWRWWYWCEDHKPERQMPASMLNE